MSNTHFSFLEDSDRRRSGGHGERDFLGHSGGVIAREGENDEMDATAAAAAVATVLAMVGCLVADFVVAVVTAVAVGDEEDVAETK